MAFQGNAFQRNAFQIPGGSIPKPPDVILLGGKAYAYNSPWNKEKEKQYQEKIRKDKAELEKATASLDEYERKKELVLINKLSANNKIAAESLRLEIKYNQEINRLLQIRALLMHRVKQNEEALILLLMAARRRLRVA